MKKHTQCIHGGHQEESPIKGAVQPVSYSTAFEYLGVEKNLYPRYFNTPNQKSVAAKLAVLEGGEDALVFASGMAAISTTFMGLLKSGDHVVFQEDLYGGTRHFIEREFPRLGIAFTLARGADAIIAAKTSETKLIYLESPSNPLLNIIDIRKVTSAARRAGIVTVIDNTFASPINQNPLALGVDVVLHSGTKYLSGHSDLCCGAAISSFELIQFIHSAAINFGGNLDAGACYRLDRSLKTLAIRVERQTTNALTVATALEESRLFARVYYPGLSSHPDHHLAAEQMMGFGAMVSFELQAGQDATAFQKRLAMIKPVLSLGGVETTICAPSLSSHALLSPEMRARIGITDGLLRLSVGIEDAGDVIQDLIQAAQGQSERVAFLT